MNPYDEKYSPKPIGQPRKYDKNTGERIMIQSKTVRPRCEVVRIYAEADEVLAQLAKMTGQSKSYIATQLIVQGSKIIKMCPADCLDCDSRDRCEFAGQTE